MKRIAVITIVLFGILQLIRPQRSNPPVDEKIALHPPAQVEKLLRRSCYDCHSNETKWPRYSAVAPFSWSIAGHVADGRKALNFSEWARIPEAIRIKRLKRAIQTVNNGMMPLSSYLLLHKEARLSKEEKETLIGYFEGLLENLKRR